MIESEELNERNEPEATRETAEDINSESFEHELQSSLNEMKDGLKRINQEKWEGVTTNDIADTLRSAESLKKLIMKELSEIAKCLNRRITDKKMQLKTSGVIKAQLVNSISKLIGDGSQIEEKTTVRKKNYSH